MVEPWFQPGEVAVCVTQTMWDTSFFVCIVISSIPYEHFWHGRSILCAVRTYEGVIFNVDQNSLRKIKNVQD